MLKRIFLFATTAVALLAAPHAVAAAQRQQAPGGGRGAAPAAEPTDEGVPAIEKVSTTHHTVTIGGKPVAYTANAGTMVIRDDDGKPKATVFYIAYTRDQEDASTRPLTFFFNGGPGSASIWLSMGLMSPRHPEMGPERRTAGAAVQPRRQSQLAARRHGPRAGRRDDDGLFAPAPGVKPSDFTGADE